MDVASDFTLQKSLDGILKLIMWCLYAKNSHTILHANSADLIKDWLGEGP